MEHMKIQAKRESDTNAIAPTLGEAPDRAVQASTGDGAGGAPPQAVAAVMSHWADPPVQRKGGAAEPDDRQLLEDQMGREWRGGDMQAYQELKQRYDQLYGKGGAGKGAPGGAEPSERQLLEEQMGREWRGGDMQAYQELKQRYERLYGKTGS